MCLYEHFVAKTYKGLPKQNLDDVITIGIILILILTLVQRHTSRSPALIFSENSPVCTCSWPAAERVFLSTTIAKVAYTSSSLSCGISAGGSLHGNDARQGVADESRRSPIFVEKNRAVTPDAHGSCGSFRRASDTVFLPKTLPRRENVGQRSRSLMPRHTPPSV